MRRFWILSFALLALLGSPGLFGQGLPPGYTIPPTTLSPNQRYGITVPQREAFESIPEPQNNLVEVATDHVVGKIGDTGVFDGMNHEHICPSVWSADSSALLWLVDGKWGYDIEILVSLADGKIKSQVDVLQLLQQEILKRTRQATPGPYAAVKKGSDGYGSWFQDGFAIDCVPQDEAGLIKFPLIFHLFLTSNTKGLEGMINVNSRMTAEVNKDGSIKIDDFHLGNDPPSRNWD